MSPNPNETGFFRALDSLTEIASRPLRLTTGQMDKARAFLGLFLLYLVNPSLAADMYAMMTCTGIPLQGQVENRLAHGKWRPVHILPDPDQTRRKSLRRFLDRLVTVGVLEDVVVTYVTQSSSEVQDTAFIDHIPPAGIISWSGMIHVKKKPKGEKTSKMYKLGTFEPALYPNKMLAQFVKPDRVDSTIRETCQQEAREIYSSLLKLQSDNRLDNENTFKVRLEPIVNAPPESKKTGQMAYVLVCFTRPRAYVELLPSAVRLALTTIG